MLLQVLYHDQPPNVFFFPSLSGKCLEILFWDNSDLKFKKGKAEVLLRYQIAHCFLKKNSHFKYLRVRNKINNYAVFINDNYYEIAAQVL